MSEDLDARDQFIQRLEAAARNTKYPVEAFLFVVHGFPRNHAHSPLGVFQFRARELCWLFHDLAVAEFGSQAREQLAAWSIRCCEDFGNIIFALIDAGLLATDEQDRLEDFRGVFDFENAFQQYATTRFSSSGVQWRLSTLFVITTVAAIALAGFTSSGIHGAVFIVLCAWLALIGLFCVLMGVRDSHDWTLALVVGVILAAFGLGGFLLILSLQHP